MTEKDLSDKFKKIKAVLTDVDGVLTDSTMNFFVTPEGKTVITAEQLGIPSIEGGKIEFSDFSTRPIELTPTTLSSKYQEVEWYELLHLLMSL